MTAHQEKAPMETAMTLDDARDKTDDTVQTPEADVAPPRPAREPMTRREEERRMDQRTVTRLLRRVTEEFGEVPGTYHACTLRWIDETLFAVHEDSIGIMVFWLDRKERRPKTCHLPTELLPLVLSAARHVVDDEQRAERRLEGCAHAGYRRAHA